MSDHGWSELDAHAPLLSAERMCLGTEEELPRFVRVQGQREQAAVGDPVVAGIDADLTFPILVVDDTHEAVPHHVGRRWHKRHGVLRRRSDRCEQDQAAIAEGFASMTYSPLRNRSPA